MSLHHNPRIVTDGLVLAYDMDNVAKSFKGKPTENLASSNFFDGNVNFTTDETIQDTLPTGKTGDVRYLNADYVVDPNRTVSIGSYTLTAGNTYTLSFYVKNINCTGFGGNLYSPTLTTSIGSITYPAVFTDRWTRVTKTFTIPTDTVSAGGNVVMSPQVFRDGGNGFFKLSMLQLEEDSFATPFVNGTRSNTQALLDMSKSKNTITATSLTYNSDGTFRLNSSNPDYLDLGSDKTIKTSGGWTVETWVKYDTVPGGYDNVNSPGNFIGSDSVSYNSWYWSVLNGKLALWNISPGTWKYGSTTLQANTWYNAVLVSDPSGTSYQMYLNGVAEGGNHTTYSWNPSYSGLRVRYIGRGNASNSRRLNGMVPVTKIYDKALSAAEIKQNFNATRGRFGI